MRPSPPIRPAPRPLVARALAAFALAAFAAAALAGGGVSAGAGGDEPDRLALAALLVDGRFGELEARLRDFETRYEEGRPRGEERLEAALFAFTAATPEMGQRLEEWVARKPDDALARLARGVHRWSVAWLERGPGPPDSLPETRRERMASRFEKADADFLAAVTRDQHLSVAHGLRINIAMASGAHALLERLTEQGLAANPTSFLVRRRYLDALRPWWNARYRDPDVLDEAARRVLERTRPLVSAHPELGRLEGYPEFITAEVAAREQRLETALTHYGRAIARGEYWAYRYRRGVVRFQLGQAAEAIEDFDRALELRPQVADVLAARARALEALGSVQRALDDWEVAVRLRPLDPAILLPQALALSRHGRDREALAALDRAMRYGRDDADVLAARGRLYLYRLEDPERAAADFGRALALAPERAGFWFDYGAALFRKRHCDAVPALNHYLTVCATREGCADEQVAWAEEALLRITRNQRCPGLAL